MLIRSKQAGSQLFSLLMDTDEIYKEIKELLMNPNAELPKPVSWVGIYDKTTVPAHLRAGAEAMTIYANSSIFSLRVISSG